MEACLYCGTIDSPPGTRAHIAPESILKNDLVLPAGAECGACNRALGRCDDAFLHHNRIWTYVLTHALPGKDGRIRKRLGHLERGKDGTLKVTVPQDALTFGADGSINIDMPNPPQFDDGRFRRGLLHMAVGYAAWKLGTHALRSERFQAVRSYVRRGDPKVVWRYAQTEYPQEPHNRQLRLTLLEESPGLVVRFKAFADDFYVDLLAPDSLRDWATTSLPKGTGYL